MTQVLISVLAAIVFLSSSYFINSYIWNRTQRKKREMAQKAVIPTIDVSEYDGLGLIIECPSGVLVRSEANGTAIETRTLEGAYVPVPHRLGQGVSETLDTELFRYFQSVFGCFTPEGIEIVHAEHIDKMLQDAGLTGIRVDRNRLRDSCESWIRVLVTEFDLDFYQGFGSESVTGALIWACSD